MHGHLFWEPRRGAGFVKGEGRDAVHPNLKTLTGDGEGDGPGRSHLQSKPTYSVMMSR